MRNLAKDIYLQRAWERDLANQEVPDLEWAVGWIQ